MTRKSLTVAAIGVTALLAVAGVRGGQQPTAGPASSRPPATPVPPNPPTDTTTATDPVAVAVEVVTSGQAVLDAETRAEVEAAVAATATPATAQAQAAKALAELDALRSKTGDSPLRWRQAVLATRTTPVDDTTVVVDVWHVGVISSDVVPPQALWSTSTFTVTHTPDGWRVATATSKPGPAPLSDPAALPVDAYTLEAALIGFTPWTGHQ